MRHTKQAGYIMRRRGWWILRYRERTGVGGEVKTVQRAVRLAQVDAQHKTRASVRAEADRILKPLNEHAPAPLLTTTLGDFIERIYFPHVEEHKRPSTQRGYKQVWEAYLQPRIAGSWLREVKTCHIQSWLRQIAKEHALSKTTLQHVKHFLSGVFRFAAQQDYRDGNPVKLAEIPAFAPDGSEGVAYTLEEITLMLSVLPEPAATVVAVAAFTGLRLGEIRGLTWEGFAAPADQESLGLLQVTRSIWRKYTTEPKTKRSKAPVPVIPQLATRLTAHRRACGSPATGPIFANGNAKPLCLDWLYRSCIKDALNRCRVCRQGRSKHGPLVEHKFERDASLPNWSGWHAFRRGLASNLNRLGVDDSVIQGILRHSTVAVTQRCYIKTVPDDAQAAMKKLSEALACSNCAPNGESARGTLLQ
jgi:integrase